ncbi:hypothetical protein, partial [Ruminococcus sp.]|uniref:hypothetical protein n=1 Tax=Ruminococcus sp. TaxID=41978 RepID=UPI00307BCBC0
EGTIAHNLIAGGLIVILALLPTAVPGYSSPQTNISILSNSAAKCKLFFGFFEKNILVRKILKKHRTRCKIEK